MAASAGQSAISVSVSVKSGPAEVIASGSVFSFNGNPVELAIGGISLIFEFEQDKTRQEHAIDPKTPDEKTVKLTLINFDSSLGLGSTAPLRFGILKGRQLYFHFRVYGLGSRVDGSPAVDHLLYYCFFAGEEVNQHG
jgi:hypothetical protein